MFDCNNTAVARGRGSCARPPIQKYIHVWIPKHFMFGSPMLHIFNILLKKFCPHTWCLTPCWEILATGLYKRTFCSGVCMLRQVGRELIVLKKDKKECFQLPWSKHTRYSFMVIYLKFYECQIEVDCFNQAKTALSAGKVIQVVFTVHQARLSTNIGICYCRIWNLAESDLGISIICEGAEDAESQNETPPTRANHTVLLKFFHVQISYNTSHVRNIRCQAIQQSKRTEYMI